VGLPGVRKDEAEGWSEVVFGDSEEEEVPMPGSRAIALAGGLAVSALALVTLASCATQLNPAGKAVKEVDPAEVAGCRLVGKVSGTSGWEGLSSAPGTTQGRNEALNEAAKRGVTHVVWDPVSKGVAQSVTGQGYDCSPEGKSLKPGTPPPPPTPPGPTPTPWPRVA
jgi:hypothetical protein